MANPFRESEQNPSPGDAITSHGELWEHIRHLRLAQALTDERILFVMKWMFPVTWAVLLLILGAMVAR